MPDAVRLTRSARSTRRSRRSSARARVLKGPEVNVAKADDAFEENGSLRSEELLDALTELTSGLTAEAEGSLLAA